VSSVSIDAGGGDSQSFVDDCTVCCRPRLVHMECDGESETGVHVWLERDDGF
jgi:Cysteine-rich CPXCG